MSATASDSETIPEIIRGVFAAGVVPLGRAVPGVWRWAGRHPVRLGLAAVVTPFIALGIAFYVLAALVVPLSFACAWVLAIPVLAYVAIARLIERVLER